MFFLFIYLPHLDFVCLRISMEMHGLMLFRQEMESLSLTLDMAPINPLFSRRDVDSTVILQMTAFDCFLTSFIFFIIASIIRYFIFGVFVLDVTPRRQRRRSIRDVVSTLRDLHVMILIVIFIIRTR